jgi:hypothetical protein
MISILIKSNVPAWTDDLKKKKRKYKNKKK